MTRTPRRKFCGFIVRLSAYTPERRKIVGAFHTPMSAFLHVGCLCNSVRRNMDPPGFLWPALFMCLCVISGIGLLLFIRWLLSGDMI